MICVQFKKIIYVVQADGDGGNGIAGGAPEGCVFKNSMYMLYSSINVANCSGVSGDGPAGVEAGAAVTDGVAGAGTGAAVGVATVATGVTVVGLGGGSMMTHGSALGAACNTKYLFDLKSKKSWLFFLPEQNWYRQ